MTFSGVDPKSVLCAFFKQGQCQKGAKCKFSHDLTMGRKGEKKSIYSDEKGKQRRFIKGLLTDRKNRLFILVHNGQRFLNPIRVYRNKIRPLFRKIQHAKHGLLMTVKSWLTCSNARAVTSHREDEFSLSLM